MSTPNQVSTVSGEEEKRWLLFSLGNEFYGSRLLDIKEVIKLCPIKNVPYMVNYFKGVINLRGQIVSIIDLREKFNLPISGNEVGLILIVETEHALIGAIVDELKCVTVLETKDIDRHPAIETKIPTQFFLGIGKFNNDLVNLIDISRCLSADEMRKVKKAM